MVDDNNVVYVAYATDSNYIAPIFSSTGGASHLLSENKENSKEMFKSIFNAEETTVKTVALDKVLSGKPVPAYIKMDVEGVELEALKGAANIIGSNYPDLAICLYHNIDDLWEIPYYIATEFPQYTLFIRQHKLTTDTVLYAVREP